MKRDERDRLKVVVHEAYMLAHSRGDKTEQILEALRQKFGRPIRTLQSWIYDVRDQREASTTKAEYLKQTVDSIISGDIVPAYTSVGQRLVWLRRDDNANKTE